MQKKYGYEIDIDVNVDINGMEDVTDLQERALIKSIIKKHKSSIFPSDKKTYQDLYDWLTQRVDIIEVQAEKFEKEYHYEYKAFKDNCYNTLGEGIYDIHALEVKMNQRSQRYYGETLPQWLGEEYPLLVWVESSSMYVDCQSILLQSEIYKWRGVTCEEYESDGTILLQYFLATTE